MAVRHGILFVALLVSFFSFAPNLHGQTDSIQAQSYFLNGRALYDEGKLLEAEKKFEKVVAIFGKSNPNTQYYLIKCSLYKEDYEKVRDVLLKDYFAYYKHADPTNPMYTELVMLVANLELMIKDREDRYDEQIINKINSAIIKYNGYFSSYSGNYSALLGILGTATLQRELTAEIKSIIELVLLIRKRQGHTRYPSVPLQTFDPLALLIPLENESDQKGKLIQSWFTDVLNNSNEIFDNKDDRYVNSPYLVKENYLESNSLDGQQYSICVQNKSATERYVYFNQKPYSFISDGLYKLFHVQLWLPWFKFQEGQSGQIDQAIVLAFESPNKEKNTLSFSLKKSASTSFDSEIHWNDELVISSGTDNFYFIIDNVSNRLMIFLGAKKSEDDIYAPNENYDSYKVISIPQGVTKMAYSVACSFSCGGGGCKEIRNANFRFNLKERLISPLLNGIEFMNQELSKYFLLKPTLINLR
jgi:hypothetical protein